MYQIGDTDYYTCVEVAKFVLHTLKETFPGVKFSVRCEQSVGTNHIEINYFGSPQESEIHAAVDQYIGTYWHSEHECRYDKFTTRGGKRVHYGANSIWVKCERVIDAAHTTKMLK